MWSSPDVCKGLLPCPAHFRIDYSIHFTSAKSTTAGHDSMEWSMQPSTAIAYECCNMRLKSGIDCAASAAVKQ